MTIPSFALASIISLQAIPGSSSNVQLPTTGSPTVAIVHNMSGSVIYALLGDETTQATPDNGMVFMPFMPIALTIGTNTYLAAISTGLPAGLHVALGS